MNQHTIAHLTLPLKYSNIELGDTIAIDKLINNQLIFGEDYSLEKYLSNNEHYVRNGQVIYPLFIIDKISYNEKNITIKATQIHDWTRLVVHRAITYDPILNFSISNSIGGNPNANVTASHNSTHAGSPYNLIGVGGKTIFRFHNEMLNLNGEAYQIKIK